jgi:hypothetical protein
LTSPLGGGVKAEKPRGHHSTSAQPPDQTKEVGNEIDDGSNSFVGIGKETRCNIVCSDVCIYMSSARDSIQQKQPNGSMFPDYPCRSVQVSRSSGAPGYLGVFIAHHGAKSVKHGLEVKFSGGNEHQESKGSISRPQ